MEFYWDIRLEYVTNAIMDILNNKGLGSTQNKTMEGNEVDI